METDKTGKWGQKGHCVVFDLGPGSKRGIPELNQEPSDLEGPVKIHFVSFDRNANQKHFGQIDSL